MQELLHGVKKMVESKMQMVVIVGNGCMQAIKDLDHVCFQARHGCLHCMAVQGLGVCHDLLRHKGVSVFSMPRD